MRCELAPLRANNDVFALIKIGSKETDTRWRSSVIYTAPVLRSYAIPANTCYGTLALPPFFIAVLVYRRQICFAYYKYTKYAFTVLFITVSRSGQFDGCATARVD